MSEPAAGERKLRDLSLGTDFLRRLESLSVTAHKLVAQGGIATRAGAVRGGRVEFLDHRGYVEGDDLRDLDWNLMARTGEPFVKVFGAEREKKVDLLLDLSPSMDAVAGKAVFACRLAAALAHIALAAGDTVTLTPLGSEISPPPPRKGIHSARDIISFLERLPFAGPLDWEREIGGYLARPQSPGACIIISDFWSENVVRLISPLARHRQDVSLLQVLTPDEISPPLSGNIRLEDSETGEEISLAVGSSGLDAYRVAVEKHLEEISGSARRHGMRYLLCRTEIPFEKLVLNYLRQGGLLR